MLAELGAACLIGFATLSGADPETLMAMTYRNLLSTLGGNRLTRETAQKMVETNDPFALPEQKDTDLGSLSQRLRDLKKLIEAKGWDSPDARTRLLGELSTVVAETETARKKQEKAIKVNHFPGIRLKNGYQKFLVPPEGGYVLILGGDADKVGPVIRFDTQTGEQTSSPGGFEFRPWGMNFSPDGTEVIIGRKDWKVQRVPWRDGQLQWKESTFLEPTQSPDQNGIDVVDQTFFDTTGTKLIVARTDYKFDHPEFMFDLKTGKSTKLQTEHKVFDTRGQASQHQWGQVPGTDRFFVVRASRQAGKLRVSQYRYKPNGKIEVIDSGTDFEAAQPQAGTGTPTAGFVTWHPSDGKSFLVRGESTVTYHADLSAKPITVYDAGQDGREIKALAFHPNGAELVVATYRDNSKVVVARVNLQSGEKVWTEVGNSFPDGVRVLPDGVILLEDKFKNHFIPPEALVP